MASSTEEESLLKKFKSFCEINEQFRLAFKQTESNSTITRSQKNYLHLHYVAKNIFTLPNYFQDVVSHFPKLLPRILSVAVNLGDAFNAEQHKITCVLLGRIVQFRKDLRSYALEYFENNPSPFFEENKISKKRSKMTQNYVVCDLDLIQACYALLRSDPAFYGLKWNWSEFVEKYFNHEQVEIQWIACHCISLVSHMSENQLKQLILSKIPLETHEKLSCIYDKDLFAGRTDVGLGLDQKPVISISKSSVGATVEISGVYISALSVSPPSSKHNIVIVDSTYNNLKKIAFALSSNKALCLQGPVGSGKTSLVEYVANKTGRKLGENFVKVQLGDQTDSKMLLGTYRCTDVPGEFIWQPGVLTQAVIEGHWLLLEDIDSASMDIASVLSSLLENGNLTVPGYRDSVAVTPGFQLFCTQRLLSNHKKHSNAIALLEKHLRTVNIDPLTSAELKKILTTQHPQFVTIQDRMLNVFCLFSESGPELRLPKTSRLISTRDFFKWCFRAAKDFDISSQASALKVLQDAIDVFCCSYPKPEDALNLAREISTHLGIINQKAEYFFKSYKPLIQLTPHALEVGRANIARNNEHISLRQTYFFTRPSAVLLERVMSCVNLKEPVLLVGETGTGKTSSVQYLANTIGQKLVVINMNQQSDSVDLLGGFKPVDLKFVITPIRNEFEEVFCEFFQVEPNKTFLGHIAFCYNEQRWTDLVKLMMKSYEAAIARLNKTPNEKLLRKWQSVGEKLYKLNVQLKQKSALAFAFIEGSLVKAVEEGYWVLLDEINLANAETLECLSGLLEGSQESLCLLERGDKEPVKRHPNFTLFACMNPSTDVGKRDLPPGLRNRFTEFYVDELTEKKDLLLLVSSYLEALSLKSNELEKIVDFYLKVRKETDISLTDGLGHKPHFSLRSLCRALTITAKNPCGMVKKSLYEAFSLSFLTQLDSQSYSSVEKMISKYLVGDVKTLKSISKQPIPPPRTNPDGYVQFEGYWVKKGKLDCVIPDDYILTDSVRKNLKDLVRIVSIGGLPVLLQGDTSVGKTSLITYLAKSSGNKCVRINNHEHTDLQEYVGSYMADSTGKLVFREGLLVEAMRKGHWIILDELNLAPSDVLEALNRVLDDNRELFIPETQETVKANSGFMLFATQNPPGSYGGRKMLSRAFRNRFVELHFNEIPPNELEVILHRRCQMAPSYAKKMINVMTELQMRRRGSAAFAGKKGFITLRDLFRWGERYRLAQNTSKLYDWDQHLADEGYLVLAGKVRRTEEKQEIITVLQKQLKREVVPDNLFTLSDKTSVVTKDILRKIHDNRHLFKNIVWTYNMRQLAVLVAKAFQFKEPVLLVGETGGGKTTVCKLIAELNGQDLVSVNCHMHTESSDFIGGLRPVRDHTDDDVNKLFEWIDGPLIQAMQKGNVFLADEISLADDSVLERLNSLLEPERTLLLAEKASDMNNIENSELVEADSRFHFIGTMNPGGDFGKKELSPALRNRFTEIWCDSCTNREDLIAIIEQNIQDGVGFGNQEDGTSGVGSKIMDFVDWFRKNEIGKRCTVSIRDILTWVSFINVCAEKIGTNEAYRHGVHLTFLDGLGTGITGSENIYSLKKLKRECELFVEGQLDGAAFQEHGVVLTTEESDTSWGINPFYVTIGNQKREMQSFTFTAPTTTYNTLRLLRGMQLNKAILLEGSPGVGKTSLVAAVAKCARHKIFRVNLSDQTDISDLFGADLPVEGGTGGQFQWRDGPLLQALRQGDWILLDELNLASQSVLEGLNACLDHRGEIFIPELGKTFIVKPGTRFFACQNPLKQGGSRRGLPQSFLNRFIQVHVTALTEDDLKLILIHQFPDFDSKVVAQMLKFNARVQEELDEHRFGNKGAPWEFNLRDLTRWCEATIYHNKINSYGNKKYRPESSVQLIYGDRMRTLSDKSRMEELFQEVFGCPISGNSPVFYATTDSIYLGDASLKRIADGVDVNVTGPEKSCLILRSQIAILRSLAYCVNLNWMSLLVGSSASGKSTVVRVLANILGKSLKTLPVTSAMDTTEILGGFEQTDYSRHLEELAKETEAILLKAVRNSLLRGRPTSHLLRLRENYSNVNSEVQIKHTMNEETKLFLKKLDELERILTILYRSEECSDKNRLEMLQKKAVKMRKSVKNEGSLNAGGKFEWVDSVLIKCLQDGSWLLVDNVNLCSAAVLDRLNALLEPRGVLTVSERGVDSLGQMIEITPHPDFRLFLTMDPKNGEISRAMRNRGVEIYISNEHHNILDLESLISHKGLKKTKYIESVLRVHAFVSDMILGEKPNISELLQTAALIAQQIDHGVEDVEAFYDTAMEIYYKNRTPMEFGCNDFGTVIKTEIGNILTLNTSDKPFCEDLTLETDRIHFESTLQKIKQQVASLERHESSVSIEQIKFFLIHFYTITSSRDLQLRKLVFESLFGGNLCEISKSLYEFVANFPTDFGEFPIDFRWIPDTCYGGRNEFGANRLVLGLHIVANLKKEQQDYVADEKNLSLLDYMIRRKNNVDNLFDDILINEFLDLMETYNDFLVNSVKSDVQLSDPDVLKILNLTTWRYFLYRFTSVSIKKISAIDRHLILTNLKVHYRWFLKYAVEEVRIILNKELPPQLEAIVTRINKSLEQQFSSLHKFGRSFQKFNDRPLPRTSLQEIEFAGAFQQASQYCDDVKYDSELKKKLIALKLTDDDLPSKLKELKSVKSGKVETTKYEIELLQIVDGIVKLKLKQSLAADSHQEFKSCSTLPADLISSLELYGVSKDAKVLHELTRALFQYLSNEANLGPNLIHRLTATLVGNAATKFGHFRETQTQHKQMSLILWRNLRQLSHSDYDHFQNESKIVRKRFEAFVKILAKSIAVETNNFQEMLEACLRQLSSLRKTSGLSDSFIKHLSSCAEHYTMLHDANFHSSLFIVYKMHMELSYVQAILNSRLALIDPSAKKVLKKKYCAENITSFEELTDSFVKLNEIYSANNKTLHPHHRHAAEMVETLKIKGEKLKDHVAVRDILYDEVVKLVNHGFATILSSKYVDGIIRDLDESISDLINPESAFRGDYRQFLKQYEAAIPSFTNLLSEWSKYVPSYPDVMEPLLSNLAEFVYGFKSSLWLLKKLLARQEFGIETQQQLVKLVEFPHQQVEETHFNRFFNQILENDATVKLLKYRIQDSFNECVVEANLLGQFDFSRFGNYVKAFVKAWNEQEKRREQQEKEAEALYRTKTKCDDKTEEEQIKSELKELFPNYHDDDFSDLRVDNSDSELLQTEQNTSGGFISLDDIKFVVDLHTTLVRSFTKTEWLNPGKNKTVVADFLHPLIGKYELFKSVCEKVLPCLDYRMDGELLESGCVLLAFVQNYGNSGGLVEFSSPINKSLQIDRFDFYKDSNVEEVKSSFHILEELKSRVMELLSEWPDHPTLQTIITVIERICDFDITSSLSRFLTGFEILLNKCHEWEEVAHSGVSLSEISQNITRQIIIWRKMELSVWKDLLNSTFRKMNEPTYKWWLYLYNIMEQFVQEEFGQVELIETLQNFVSKSNLAEFETRLSLLHAFHCHSVHAKRTERIDAFINILWNVHSYFRQFSQVVANKIKDLRGPIEKKLRDYVKIVRWKDVNYWAVKETVDKTHKTLHKFVREFRDAVNQPVLPLLVNISSNKIESVGIWDRPQRNLVKVYHYTSDPANYVAKESQRKKLEVPVPLNFEALQQKSDLYFGEARKLCKDSISAMKYPHLIQNLDNLVGQIIETSTHLQGLEVDMTLPKSKQKSAAKSILHQKHRALADLFKTLTKLGLSFRTGILETKLKNATDDFLLKPVDIAASFTHINCTRRAEKILTIWEGCETYYLRSLMRADVLDTALKTPAPDLGQQNIERCRGFSAHFLTFTHRHKTLLIESSNLFYYLRHYTTQLTKLCESKNFVPLEVVEEIQNVMKRVYVFMSQFAIFLNTCPDEDFKGEETCQIVLTQHTQEFIKYKNDDLWEKSRNLINEIINQTNKISVELEKSKGRVPHFENTVIQFKFVPADVDGIRAKLDKVKTGIDTLSSIFGQIHATKSLTRFVSELEAVKKTLLDNRSEFDDKASLTEVQNLSNSLIETILQVVKTVSKKYPNQINENCEDNEDIHIDEEHLKSLIGKNLEADLDDMRFKDILDLCEKLATQLFNLAPKQLEEGKLLISFVTPLLEQLLLYHQYFLTQQVSAYRVVCKLNSILLNIFIDLASKGFCIPPELSDEMDEGAGKPSDGLGLGDGEGKRDVSDRIESEDQLEDAQPAGEEKQKEDDADCKEEDKGIEMSEDFDSKLQDVNQKEDEEDDESNSDADEQMGETEDGVDKQNKENFKSDDEEEENEAGEGLEQKEERGDGEGEGESELAAKDEKSKPQDKPDEASSEKEEKKKEINEMEEPEYDDEQTDPYHGNQPELPEPEPMDLPDDLQLDEGQEANNEDQNEENPFDIDTMKEDNPFDGKEKDEDKPDKEENNEEIQYSSDDEEITKKEDDNEEIDRQENEESAKDKNEESTEDREDIDDDNISDQPEESGMDQTHTNEENVEAMEVQNAEATDKTIPNQSKNQQSNEAIDELCQEDKPDKEGVGQSQMEESSTGHSAQTSTPQDMQSSKRQREEDVKKHQKPGESDSQRSLGNVNEPVKKKLKTMDTTDEDGGDENNTNEEEAEAEMYKHIKEAKESEMQVLDVATKEQKELQKDEPIVEEKDDNNEDVGIVEEEEKIDTVDTPVEKPEKTESKKNTVDKKQHPEGDVLDEIQEVEVEGEVVQTVGVARGGDTTYNTLYDELKSTTAIRLTQEEANFVRSEVEKQLSSWTDLPSDSEADKAWQKISSVTASLAQDLSEQLRLVLEPTQASRLKGDFRTGRRINMRKVIPYIASQFRKDKIWLRRTKPSKREYQIVLAIDDSSSMADNHSKELAFESVALISKALFLLESGQLSVVSFGENIEILHKLTEQFSDKSGVKLLQKFKFDQNKTCVAKLVNFVSELFAQSHMQSTAPNAKLLVIVSDGRGVFSEGEGVVRQAVRSARLANIFMVFVIIDNPENKSSILDIRMPCFKDGKLLGIKNYMDVFPFSFYIILREINSLPIVLSDALRQWFEVVSNIDKQ